jgi:hypothetical protein
MKLKNVHPEGRDSFWYFYCPGCKEVHCYRDKAGDKAPGRPIWQFDGNTEKPTFSPSLLRTTEGYKDEEVNIPRRVCHLFLTAGKLQFLGDCTHELAGQTVDLPDLPEKYREDSYYG